MKHGFTKTILIALLILGAFRVFADDTNIIVATDWSKPVVADLDYSVRGRLVITDGSEPAYGGPKSENHTMMFVELQNTFGAHGGESVKLYFNVSGLKCNLVDSEGKPAPKPKLMLYDGRPPFAPYWIVLPYNSTIRLFVNPGSKSPLRITKSGLPWEYWEIPSNDTNDYYLSGTLTISTDTNAMLIAKPHDEVNPHEYHEWEGTLVFSKVKISANQFARYN
jgi:hypothetical protein